MQQKTRPKQTKKNKQTKQTKRQQTKQPPPQKKKKQTKKKTNQTTKTKKKNNLSQTNRPPRKKQKTTNKQNQRAKPNCSHLFPVSALLRACQLQVSGSESNFREAFPSLSLSLWVIPKHQEGLLFFSTQRPRHDSNDGRFFCT